VQCGRMIRNVSLMRRVKTLGVGSYKIQMGTQDIDSAKLSY